MKSRSPLAISHDLEATWQREAPRVLAEQGDLGDDLRRLLMEALDGGVSSEVLALCSKEVLQYGNGHVLLQREAERLACHDFYPSSMSPQSVGRECALLALPAMGSTDELDEWLQRPAAKRCLEKHAREHLARLMGISENRIEKSILLEGTMGSASVAALTPDARRVLLQELLEIPRAPGTPSIVGHLQDMATQRQISSFPTEGIILLAVVARTDWESDTPMAQRLTDLIIGNMDDESLAESEDHWVEAAERIGLPSETMVGQPVSLNDALMQTLRSYLFSARVHAHALAGGQGLLSNPPELPAIQMFSVFQGEDGNVVIEAQTEEGDLPTLVVSPHWAMTEGEDAWREAIAETFQVKGVIDGPNRPGPASESMIDSHDQEGDHPAWRWAHPTPRQLH